MIEKKRFSTIEKTSTIEADTIDLEINKKRLIPFTGNRLLYATTVSGKKVVIKIPQHSNQAQHEWTGLCTAQQANIPVPKPIALIHYSPDQLAIISEFIKGNNLYFNPNPETKIEMGKQLQSLHQNAQIDGKIWELSGRNTFIYYDRHIFNWSKGQPRELQADSKTASLLNKHVDDMVDFCKHLDPVFNHNDLHDGQIISDRKKQPIFIDFGNWTEESWLNDLGYYLFHLIRTDRKLPEEFTNFLTGYLQSNKLTEHEKSILTFYLLFISSRALHYFDNRQSSYLPTAKNNHKKVLTHLESEIIWKKY